MLAKNLDSQIHELRELRRMADELAAEIDTIQDAIKAEMTAALKKALPDLAAQFTKTSTVRRFSVA